MWVVKTRGETYYVNHVECTVPWSTKETPDNSHTKGSIKIKRCLLVIDDENTATVTELTPEDEQRLRGNQTATRLITSDSKLRQTLEQCEIAHGGIKTFGGVCSTTWYVVEIYNAEDLLMLQLAVSNLRVLKPNEDYYRLYDRYDSDYINEDELGWEDLYDD